MLGTECKFRISSYKKFMRELTDFSLASD